MNQITFFFIILTIFILIYIIYSFKLKSRIPILVEFFFILIYSIVFVILLNPSILNIVEDILNIDSAINFIIYFSIFLSYFIIFLLYRKTEFQREDITKLNTSLAFTNHKLEKLSKNLNNKKDKKDN